MNKQLVVACDFDGTIHNHEDREDGYRMGKPYAGARETLQRMRDLGAKIIIHTCRARSAQGEPDPDPTVKYRGCPDTVREWLDYFQIPYDSITALKPMADAYVDDKAVPFLGDWKSVERELLSLFYLGVHS